MDGSGAQPQAAPQTTPKRAGDFGVHSEVGKLRKVLVHRPELSLQRLTRRTTTICCLTTSSGWSGRSTSTTSS